MKKFFGRGLTYTGLITAMTLTCVIVAAVFGRFGLSVLFAGNPSVLDYTYMLIPTIICSGLVTVSWLFSTLMIVMRDFKCLLIGDVLAVVVLWNCATIYFMPVEKEAVCVPMSAKQ